MTWKMEIVRWSVCRDHLQILVGLPMRAADVDDGPLSRCAPRRTIRPADGFGRASPARLPTDGPAVRDGRDPTPDGRAGTARRGAPTAGSQCRTT